MHATGATRANRVSACVSPGWRMHDCGLGLILPSTVHEGHASDLSGGSSIGLQRRREHLARYQTGALSSKSGPRADRRRSVRWFTRSSLKLILIF